MGENNSTGNKINTDELVEITFRNNRGDMVTRRVYPEVAKFHTSREAALVEHRRGQSLYNRDMQRYVWEKEDEYYADPENAGRPDSFDSYSAQREWQRLPENRNRNRENDERYNDFVSGSARNPDHRYSSENPNSWAILREEAAAAGHKVITWLIDHTLESEHEATILVKYMPASAPELWDIAKDDNDMCTVFDRYMERAEAAGIFEGMDNAFTASMKEQMALRSYIRRTYGSGYARDFMARVAPILRAEREDAVAQAKAEWQKYDEAYAENVHRNRSEGARRAAETRKANAAKAVDPDFVGPVSASEGAFLGTAPEAVSLVHPDRVTTAA